MLTNLGIAYSHAGQTDSALRALRAAAGLRPPFAPAWLNLAVLWRRIGRPAEAERAAKTARAIGLRLESMKIRRAGRHDLQTIASVHARSWQDAYRNMLPEDYLRDRVSHDLANHWQGMEIGPDDVVLVAEDSEVIGFVAVWCRPTPFIDNLHVLPTWRSRGTGRQLMATAAEHLIRQGHSTAYLWVIVENKEALKFYERLGGVPEVYETKEMFGHKSLCAKVVWADITAMAR